MGNVCNSEKPEKNIEKKLLFQNYSIKGDLFVSSIEKQEKSPLVKISEKLLFTEKNEIFRKKEVFSSEEFNDTMGFLTNFMHEKQKILINELLVKPIQLKINKRASKFLPELFSSEYEGSFIRNFSYLGGFASFESGLLQKKKLFQVFNKDILEKMARNSLKSKISKENVPVLNKKPGLKRTNSLKNPLKIQKSPAKNDKNLKVLNNSNRKKPISQKKPPLNIKRPMKSRSISQNNSNDTLYIKFNLIPLLEKEKKNRADIFLSKKTHSKPFISSNNGWNQYYNLFSYSKQKKQKESPQKSQIIQKEYPIFKKKTSFSSSFDVPNSDFSDF